MDSSNTRSCDIRVHRAGSQLKRFARLMDRNEVLLSKSIIERIQSIEMEYKLSPREVENLRTVAKQRIFEYNRLLLVNMQYYLAIDNSFLQSLTSLDPASIGKPDYESSVLSMAKCFCMVVSEVEYDDLKHEVRLMQLNIPNLFDDKLDQYKKQANDCNVLSTSRIDICLVWAPIINNKSYPIMSKLLSAALSLFHSTAAVEGSVCDTRNFLKDRAHRSTDKILEAKMTVQSSIRSAKTQCCYDYDYETSCHINDWRSSRQVVSKLQQAKNVGLQASDIEEFSSGSESQGDDKTKRIEASEKKMRARKPVHLNDEDTDADDPDKKRTGSSSDESDDCGKLPAKRRKTEHPRVFNTRRIESSDDEEPEKRKRHVKKLRKVDLKYPKIDGFFKKKS
jgi:hypothetical protein